MSIARINIRQHGGNNLSGAVDIVQTSSYYPFGMVMNQKTIIQLGKIINKINIFTTEKNFRMMIWVEDVWIGRFCRINKLDVFSIANTSFYAAKLLKICQLDRPYP